MAENNADINIEIGVTGDGSINKATNSLKQLKQELKEAQSAALNGDGKAAKRVAELRDKMEDLADSTKSLQGSGVEKVSSSFNLLGDGFKNMDLDKVKTGFAGVGAAMSAIPIFLLVEGITYVVQNFKELSEGSGFLATVLKGIGEVFTWLGDKITEFTDMLGLSNSALEEQGEIAAASADKAKEALAAQNQEYDNQIALAKAAGKSTVELEKKKQEEIIKTNLLIAEQQKQLIVAQIRAGEAVSEDAKKRLTESINAIRQAKVQEQIIDIEDKQVKKENAIKHQEDLTAAYNKGIDDRLAADQRLADYEKYLSTIRIDLYKSSGIEKKKLDDEELMVSNASQDYQTDKIKQELDSRKASFRDWLTVNKVGYKETQELAAASLQTTQNLSDAIFASRLAKTKKGSAEEQAIAKKQFEINKKLAIASAIINGASAVSVALSTPDPTGILTAIRVAAAITASAAQIAKIRGTQFEGGGGDSGSGSTPSGTGSTPNVNSNPPTSTFTPPTNQTTSLNEAGQVTGRSGMLEAFVVETKITDKQKRVNRLEDQATF